MVGMPRDIKKRLETTVTRGMSSFYVPMDIDWKVGETIVIAPTNMRTMDTDICVIASISNG